MLSLLWYILFIFTPSLTKMYFFFYVCIKCQVNFPGCYEGCILPLGMCGRVVDCGSVLCISVCLGTCMCVCMCVCVSLRVGKGEWGKGKVHGKAKRETRGCAGVRYSMVKLVHSEELESCVEGVHTSVCVCLVWWQRI